MPTDRGNVKVFLVTRFSARRQWCANMAFSGEQKGVPVNIGTYIQEPALR
jgi:hypothetical protein